MVVDGLRPPALQKTADRAVIEPEACGSTTPLRSEPVRGDAVVLAPAGLHGGALPRARRVHAPRFDLRVDLGSTSRERFDDLGGHPADLRDAVARLRPVDAEPPAERSPEGGFVDIA